MESQKKILGHYLYKWFLGINDPDIPKGICKDYIPPLFRRTPTYWSDIREISPLISIRTQMVVLTISAVIGCLEKQIHLLDTESMTADHFDELAWEALVEGDNQKNLSPLLQFLVNKGVIKDPDESGAAVVHKTTWMAKAWETTYIGEHHINLLTNIHNSIVTNPRENTAAIIQSSGFGKSRTVDEMAKLVATIPMNIRDARENDQGAYPLPDENLTKLFTSISSNVRDLDEAVQAFHRFFTILFRQFSKKVDALLQRDSDLSLPILLRNDLAKSRSRSLLYKAVCEEYFSRDFVAAKLDNAIAELGCLIAKLKPTIDNPVSLILYIAAAHTLTELRIRPIRRMSTNTNREPTLYEAMIKAAAKYCEYRFFILFLSTSSELRRLDVPPETSRSARQAEAHVIAPFTEMPFDCHPELQNHKISPNLLLKDIQTHRFITYFGRPLWASAFLGEDGDIETKIRLLAVTKLTCLAPSTFADLQKLNGTPMLAVLDTLLNLEYSPAKTQTRQLVDDMVAGNMRTTFSVPTDGTSMYSGYPSEPVLAEAALDTIEMITSDSCQEPMAKLYNELSDDAKEALDVGQRGENVAKIILLRAFMAAVRVESAESKFYPWRTGCSLITFLKQLTATTYHSKVLELRPDNTEVEGQCLDEAFKNAWVRFTHFARGADDSAMTTSMAWVAFIRGMAMIGWHGQGSVDLHIPVLLHKDKPITEGNMSGILVQVKLREAWTKPSTVAINADKICYFPGPENPRGSPEPLDEANKSRPYISLVMEFGKPVKENLPPTLVVKDTDNQKKIKSEKPKPESTLTTEPRSHKPNFSGVESQAVPSKEKHLSVVHPRYSLFVYGQSHGEYGCIPEDQSTQDTYNELLDIGVDDYPEGRDLKYVYQMKPFWSTGKDCFNWVEDEFLKHPPSTSKKVLIGHNPSMDVDQSDDTLHTDPMDVSND